MSAETRKHQAPRLLIWWTVLRACCVSTLRPGSSRDSDKAARMLLDPHNLSMRYRFACALITGLPGFEAAPNLLALKLRAVGRMGASGR
jgi:hypothetical protein